MITTSDISEVRKRSGAGVLDCKKALVSSNGNIEEALDFLRKKGLAAASKRALRSAAEGLIAISSHENEASVIELNCETDFASKNDDFKKTASNIADLALKHNLPIEKLTKIKNEAGTIDDQISAIASSIQENIKLRRIKRLSIDKGSLYYYLHGKSTDNLARIISLVTIQCIAKSSDIDELGKKLAMQIAAQSPRWLDKVNVDSETLEKERLIAKEQTKNINKPTNVIEKIVEGRLGKFLDENCLLRQTSIFDPSMNISKLVESTSTKVGAKLRVLDFIRMEVGEGIEKQKQDFASEVAATIKN